MLIYKSVHKSHAVVCMCWHLQLEKQCDVWHMCVCHFMHGITAVYFINISWIKRRYMTYIMLILGHLVAVQQTGYHLVWLAFYLATLRQLGFISVGLSKVIMKLMNLIISACTVLE